MVDWQTRGIVSRTTQTFRHARNWQTEQTGQSTWADEPCKPERHAPGVDGSDGRQLRCAVAVQIAVEQGDTRSRLS